jgi:hypothetical protein
MMATAMECINPYQDEEKISMFWGIMLKSNDIAVE